MNRSPLFLLIAAALLAGGCASQQSIVDGMQPDAMHVAQRRGAFELSCPAATATMLSSEMIQSPTSVRGSRRRSAPNTRWASKAAGRRRRIS